MINGRMREGKKRVRKASREATLCLSVCLSLCPFNIHIACILCNIYYVIHIIYKLRLIWVVSSRMLV